jgi:Icc-related predicted phosphoesterase
MRVLALADRPPRPDPRAYLAQQRVDAVLCLGDLQPAWLEGIADASVPKLGVYGNHDEEPYMRAIGIEDVHLRLRVLAGVRFAGFEGCVRYHRKGGRQYTQQQARRMVRKLPGADVLLCHCPPWGVNDDPTDPAHVGWLALRDWVEEHRPRYLLHGHTHPPPGGRVTRIGETEVRYVSGASAVTLELPSAALTPTGWADPSARTTP